MKQPLRTIVIEDERLPRLSLLQKLEDFRPQIEVVDSCRQVFCLDPEGDHTVRAQLAGHFLGQDNIVSNFKDETAFN